MSSVIPTSTSSSSASAMSVCLSLMAKDPVFNGQGATLNGFGQSLYNGSNACTSRECFVLFNATYDLYYNTAAPDCFLANSNYNPKQLFNGLFPTSVSGVVSQLSSLVPVAKLFFGGACASPPPAPLWTTPVSPSNSTAADCPPGT